MQCRSCGYNGDSTRWEKIVVAQQFPSCRVGAGPGAMVSSPRALFSCPSCGVVKSNTNDILGECCKRWRGRVASADVQQVSTAMGGLIYTEMFQCAVKFCPECGGKL